jgi:hypothetical protein
VSDSIIDSYPIPPNTENPIGAIVLHRWDQQIWAIHFHNYEDNAYYQGDYCHSFPVAQAQFERRINRELGLESRQRPTPKIYDLGMSDLDYVNLYTPIENDSSGD